MLLRLLWLRYFWFSTALPFPLCSQWNTIGGALFHFWQHFLLARHQLFQPVTQVFHQVEFVRNLLSLRSAFLCSRRILSSSIAADDIYFRVGKKPSSERFLLAIRNYEGFPLVALRNLKGIEQKTLIIAC